MATKNIDGICAYCQKPVERGQDRTLVISPHSKFGKKLYHGDCYVDFVANEYISDAQQRRAIANQIFTDLDTIAFEHIEPEKLENFYDEFSKAKDKETALAIAQKFSMIGFSTEKYDNVKKKYGVR